MTQSWNWNNVKSEYWKIPSQDVYYFLYRWKTLNKNTLLDLGCGIGRHAILFAENGFEVTAYDLSPSAIESVEKAAADSHIQISTCIGDLKALPFEDCQFDAILAYHSIYHLDTEGMGRMIDRLGEILKPKGEIFLSLISKSTFSYSAEECKIIDENVRLKEEEDGSILPHYFVDYDDIETLFGKKFDFLNIRHIEDFTERGPSWHYFVHMELQ